ncbi:hypothetical protein V6N11_013739 [Hibiscus sabdariffa]|uniref:Uncharacterized protein n=1 Tax=Hibiscus sabdariffa TaxID=183260 RepID=A0ABR2PCS7_9ROSI
MNLWAKLLGLSHYRPASSAPLVLGLAQYWSARPRSHGREMITKPSRLPSQRRQHRAAIAACTSDRSSQCDFQQVALALFFFFLGSVSDHQIPQMPCVQTSSALDLGHCRSL